MLHYRPPPIEDKNPHCIIAFLVVVKLLLEACRSQACTQVRGDPAHEGDLTSGEVPDVPFSLLRHSPPQSCVPVLNAPRNS